MRSTASSSPYVRSRRPGRSFHARLEAMEGRFLLTGSVPSIGGDPIVKPSDFRVTAFASGLDYPTGIDTATDGSLLVVVNVPRSGSTSFYNSTSRVLRLVDTDGDGVADGSPTILASGLPGSSSALARAGNYVIVTSSNGTISFLRTGATPDAALTNTGAINLDFASGWLHPTFALAVRPQANGDYDVFFNIGSQFNGIKKDSQGNILFDANGVAIPDPTVDKVPASGLISGDLEGDAIYMVRLHDNAGTPVLTNVTKVATGLRNAASMAIDPATGDLYFADNGIDGTDGGNASYSTDTLQRLPAADIGTKVLNAGFPYSYTLTNLKPGQPDVVVNPNGRVTPLASFQPLPDSSLPDTGSQSEGASGFAMAPPMFPAGLNKGVFIGFHGKFSSGGTANEENPMLFVDASTGKYFDFIGNSEPNIGHLDGATFTADSLFVSDLATNGKVSGGAGLGVIYQIKALNHAPTLTAVSDQTVNEGQAVKLTLSASDQDPGQSLTYSLGAGAPAGATIDPVTGVFSWTPPDGPSSVVITVFATDNGKPALQASTSFKIDVKNVAPTVTLSPPPAFIVVGTFNGKGSFTDPGKDTFKATVDYGDRPGARPIRLALKADGTFKLNHRYTKSGTYTITVKVTDSDGDVGTQTIQLVVKPRFVFSLGRLRRWTAQA